MCVYHYKVVRFLAIIRRVLNLLKYGNENYLFSLKNAMLGSHTLVARKPQGNKHFTILKID